MLNVNLQACSPAYQVNAERRHVGKALKKRFLLSVFWSSPILRKVLARNYELPIVNDKAAHLPVHSHAWVYEPRFNQTKILNKSNNREARKLAEACYIRKRGTDCVTPRLHCTLAKWAFLKTYCSIHLHRCYHLWMCYYPSFWPS